MFHACYVVNLDKAPDRLCDFMADIPREWPFPAVQRLRATDGALLPVPSHWRDGAGAYGIYQTYRKAIQQAIAEGASQPIAFFEDDCLFVPDFPRLALASLANVPADWELFFFGASVPKSRVPVAPGVVRMTGNHGTYSWAVHPRFFQRLIDIWDAAQKHVDWAIAEKSHDIKLYACDPFLTGHAAGPSFVSMGTLKRQTWDERTDNLFDA